MASAWPGNALLTTEQFLIACPEFGATDFKLVDYTVKEAAEELDPQAWGQQLAAAHKYLTGHKLSTSPQGQGTRLILPKTGELTSTYMLEFRRLIAQLPMAGGLAGWPCGMSVPP